MVVVAISAGAVVAARAGVVVIVSASVIVAVAVLDHVHCLGQDLDRLSNVVLGPADVSQATRGITGFQVIPTGMKRLHRLADVAFALSDIPLGLAHVIAVGVAGFHVPAASRMLSVATRISHSAPRMANNPPKMSPFSTASAANLKTSTARRMSRSP